MFAHADQAEREPRLLAGDLLRPQPAVRSVPAGDGGAQRRDRAGCLPGVSRVDAVIPSDLRGGLVDQVLHLSPGAGDDTVAGGVQAAHLGGTDRRVVVPAHVPQRVRLDHQEEAPARVGRLLSRGADTPQQVLHAEDHQFLQQRLLARVPVVDRARADTARVRHGPNGGAVVAGLDEGARRPDQGGIGGERHELPPGRARHRGRRRLQVGQHLGGVGSQHRGQRQQPLHGDRGASGLDRADRCRAEVHERRQAPHRHAAIQPSGAQPAAGRETDLGRSAHGSSMTATTS